MNSSGTVLETNDWRVLCLAGRKFSKVHLKVSVLGQERKKQRLSLARVFLCKMSLVNLNCSHRSFGDNEFTSLYTKLAS